MSVVLRLIGASLLALAFFHVVLWRAFRWGEELPRLSPINARVFVVHTFFVTFVLVALGLLSLVRPDLLLARSDLARLLLGAIVTFWLARLLFQRLVFDRALVGGWTGHGLFRAGASLLWATYVVVYALAFLGQLEAPAH